MSSLKTAKVNINWIQLALTIFCISWLNNGIIYQTGVVGFTVFLAAFVLWLMFALGTSNFVEKYINRHVWMLLYAVIVLISSAGLSPFWNKQTYGVVYLIVMVAFASCYVDEKYKEERKVIVYFYLIESVLMALRSIFVLAQDETYIRQLAGGADTNSEISGFFVAHFDNIYTFAILTIFIISLTPRAKNRFLLIAMAIVFTVCLYLANFGTAILLVPLFALAMLLIRNPKIIAVTLVVMTILFFVFEYQVAEFAEWMAEFDWLSEFIRGKLIDISDTIKGSTYYQHDNTLTMRIGYITDAIEVFKNNWVFGVYGFNDLISQRNLLRDHNVWFDLFAYFGVTRIIPFLAFLFSWLKQNKSCWKGYKYSPISYVFLFWSVLGFFNPVNKMAIQLFLFAILPMTDVLVDENALSYDREEVRIKFHRASEKFAKFFRRHEQ